jgi:hypothetical protein
MSRGPEPITTELRRCSSLARPAPRPASGKTERRGRNTNSYPLLYQWVVPYTGYTSSGRPVLMWKADHLRLTAFSSGGMRGPGLWQSLLQSEPDSLAQTKVQVTETGAWNGLAATLVQQPGRFEVRLGALQPPNRPPGAELSRAELQPSVGGIRQLAELWLQTEPPAVRLAFGAVLVIDVPDRRSGYLQLARYVPRVQLDPDSQDFFYQINRPRVSRVREGLSINRLSRWAVMQTELASLSIAGGQIVATNVEGERNYTARLEFDVNTTGAHRDVFQSNEAIRLWGELVDLGLEIARDGDVP